MVDMVEALGATALPIPYADVYSTLERGTAVSYNHLQALRKRKLLTK